MILRIVKWVCVIAFALVLQSTIVRKVALFGVEPDLTIVALFLLALKHGVLQGLYVGFIVGLTQDLYSPSILGQLALAKTLIGFFVGLFNEKVMRTDPVMKAVLLLLAFVLHDAVFLTAQVVKTAESAAIIPTRLAMDTLPRAAYSLVVVLLVYIGSLVMKPAGRR